MIEFIQITNIEDARFNAAMEIYVNAFPANERQPLDVVATRVANGRNKLYTGAVNNEVAFMAMLWPLQNTGFILLDYMATGFAYRGQNIGSRFLQYLQPVLQAQKKHLIIEAEHPGFGTNKEERQRRIAFYKRNGARLLKDVRFVLPALQGDLPTEMVLMILPDYNNGRIDALVVNALIRQIYAELYGREADELLSLNAGEQIELD